jgi:NitT/TauT family transport system ATP-binding protein
MSNRTLVSWKDLNVTYRGSKKEFNAIRDFTSEIADGEFISIIGKSGCGKTTLLKATSGLISPKSGNVSIDGTNVKSPYTDVGIVFQMPVLLEWKNVLDNVLFSVDMRRQVTSQDRDEAMQLLRMVGLSGFEFVHPWELSGGMQQRVSICRALIHHPKLLLMDEPFGALDAMTREQMDFELLKLWMERKVTVLFVTHNIHEAVLLSDRVMVMSKPPSPSLIDMVKIDLPRPRSLEMDGTKEFNEYVKELRAKIAKE